MAGALPLIVLPFGVPGDGKGFWQTSRWALPSAIIMVAGALLTAIPAASLIWFGISNAANSKFWHPLPWGLSGVYQPMLAAWVALAMLCFARLWRVPALETLSAMAAVLAGVALGLLSLDLHYHPQNVLSVVNPLEHLLAIYKEPAAGGDLIGSLVHGLGGVIERRTFVLYTSPRPTIFLEWLVIAATFVAWKAGERKLVGQVAILMLVVWGIDAIGTLRGLKLEYFIYTDPLVIIAAAWLLAQLPALQRHRWAFQIGVLFVCLHILLSQAEPVKHTMMRDQPLEFCTGETGYAKRIERFPFCPAAPAQPARTP